MKATNKAYYCLAPFKCPLSNLYGGFSIFEVDTGSHDKQVGNLIDFAIDSQMNVYLADSDKSRLVKWSSGDSYSRLQIILDKNGTSDSDLYGLKYPQGLFMDQQDQLFICDSGNRRILKRTSDEYITIVGQGIDCEHIFVDENTGDI
jgi:hypothetical protein